MYAYIGSSAAQFHGLPRPTSDLDILSPRASLPQVFERYVGTAGLNIKTGEKIVIKNLSCGRPLEISVVEDKPTDVSLWAHILSDPNTIGLGMTKVLIPSRDVLYTLKLSHRFKKNSPHFLKTMRDIQWFRSQGAKVFNVDWLKAREKETYNYAHPSLNTTKAGFFRDKYLYDHDSLHWAVKHLDRPAYLYFKKSEADVACSREKFFSLPYYKQLLAGLEESYVLALERSQVPSDFVVSPRKSFDIALSKVCTSITSGYFREFCWENYDEISGLYGDYVFKFRAGLTAGVVLKADNY